MTVAAGDVCLVTFSGDLAGSTVLNTFHYGMASVVGTPTQTAVATEIATKLESANNLVPKFLACAPPSYTLNEVWVQFILNTRFRKFVSTVNLPGTFAQDANTANLAGVVTRAGAAANKRNIGSIHVPYPNLDPGTVGGITSPGWQTAAVAFAAVVDDMQTLATLGTIQPILIHGTSTLNAIPIVDAFVQATVRVMRRRTKGRGI